MATDPSSPLATVGLPEVSGDPVSQRRSAEAWRDLSEHLSAQATRLTDLAAAEHWEGPSARSFQDQARNLADRARTAATIATQVGHVKHAHSDEHAKVLHLLRQLAIEIGAMLAFWALGGLFPPVLAAANAWLNLLVVQGSRIIRFLAAAIGKLVGMLMRTRAWILHVMKLSWRTERFSFGYGRLLIEAARDFGIDLTANWLATLASGKPFDLDKALEQASIAIAGAGFSGILDGTGLKRLRDADTGELVRGADDLPQFQTFGEQAKTAIDSWFPRPERVAADAPVRNPHLEPLEHQVANAEKFGLRGSTGEQRTLAAELNGLWASERQLAQRRADARRAVEEAARHAAETPSVASTEALTLAQGTMSRVQTETHSVITRARDLTNRLDASRQLAETRRLVRSETTLREQWSDAWDHNPWRKSFQPLKSTPVTVIYDGNRYFVKGFITNSAKAAAEGDPEWWRRGLVGGGTSALRGMGNSFAQRSVIKDGFEDTLFKTGGKIVDTGFNRVVSEL